MNVFLKEVIEMEAILKPPKNALSFQQNLEKKIILIKKITMCIVAVIMIAISFGQLFTPANAAITTTVDSKGYKIYTTSGGDIRKVADINAKVFGGAALDLAATVYGGLGPVNRGMLQINSTNAPFWTTMQSAYGTLSAIGAGLALFWCMLELIEKASTGHITGEFMLQLGIKFTIAALVISSGGEIANDLITFGNGIASALAGKLSMAGPDTTNTAQDTLFLGFYEKIKDANIFDCLGAMLPLILSAFLMRLCTIILFVLLAGRMIDIGVRYIFFPIGASDVFTAGLHSPGFRYMRRMVASVLQGIVMYTALVVGQSLMTADVNKIIGVTDHYTVSGVLLNSIWPIIVIVSTVGAMLKASSITNDIMGG